MKTKALVWTAALVSIGVSGVVSLKNIPTVRADGTEGHTITAAPGRLQTSPKVTQLIEGWKSYLRKFDSVDMEWTTRYQPILTAQEKTNGAAAERLSGSGKSHLVVDGENFRSEFWDIGSSNKLPNAVTAYNGEYLQQLDGKGLNGKDNIVQQPLPAAAVSYGRTPPFLQIFGFADQKRRGATLADFQGDALWNEFARSVQSISDEERNGKAGTKLTVHLAPLTCEVWVDQSYGLPTQWKSFNAATGKLVADGRVTRFAELNAGGEKVLMPMSLSSTLISGENGEKKTIVSAEVEARSLKINQPVAAKNFTIEHGETRFLDAQGNDLPQ
jgi:hypothetical protein